MKKMPHEKRSFYVQINLLLKKPKKTYSWINGRERLNQPHNFSRMRLPVLYFLLISLTKQSFRLIL